MEPTKELPTAEGFYWVLRGDESPTIVEVYFRQKVGYVVCIGEEAHYVFANAPTGILWLGPITRESLK